MRYVYCNGVECLVRNLRDGNFMFIKVVILCYSFKEDNKTVVSCEYYLSNTTRHDKESHVFKGKTNDIDFSVYGILVVSYKTPTVNVVCDFKPSNRLLGARTAE